MIIDIKIVLHTNYVAIRTKISSAITKFHPRSLHYNMSELVSAQWFSETVPNCVHKSNSYSISILCLVIYSLTFICLIEHQ